METIDDNEMDGLCREMQTRFASRGMDLFTMLCFDDTQVPFALATDDCCFLVDRVRQSVIRDYYRLKLAAGKLAEKEPQARIFGILLVGSTQGIASEFLRFAGMNDIALLEPEKAGEFIEGKLAKTT
jgi:hypothetical protein